MTKKRAAINIQNYIRCCAFHVSKLESSTPTNIKWIILDVQQIVEEIFYRTLDGGFGTLLSRSFLKLVAYFIIINLKLVSMQISVAYFHFHSPVLYSVAHRLANFILLKNLLVASINNCSHDATMEQP